LDFFSRQQICAERDDGDGFWVSSQDNKSVEREMMQMAAGYLFEMINLCGDDGNGFWVYFQDDKSVHRDMMERWAVKKKEWKGRKRETDLLCRWT
jgi:hypothetical protein